MSGLGYLPDGSPAYIPTADPLVILPPGLSPEDAARMAKGVRELLGAHVRVETWDGVEL